MYNNDPMCWCKDGYKIDSYIKLCVKNQIDVCDDVICATNEECKIYNNNPTCWCEERYKRNSYMACMKDKTDGCNGITCGTNEEYEMSDNHPTCTREAGYTRNPRTAECMPDKLSFQKQLLKWIGHVIM